MKPGSVAFLLVISISCPSLAGFSKSWFKATVKKLCALSTFKLEPSASQTRSAADPSRTLQIIKVVGLGQPFQILLPRDSRLLLKTSDQLFKGLIDTQTADLFNQHFATLLSSIDRFFVGALTMDLSHLPQIENICNSLSIQFNKDWIVIRLILKSRYAYADGLLEQIKSSLPQEVIVAPLLRQLNLSSLVPAQFFNQLAQLADGLKKQLASDPVKLDEFGQSLKRAILMEFFENKIRSHLPCVQVDRMRRQLESAVTLENKQDVLTVMNDVRDQPFLDANEQAQFASSYQRLLKLWPHLNSFGARYSCMDSRSLEINGLRLLMTLNVHGHYAFDERGEIKVMAFPVGGPTLTIQPTSLAEDDLNDVSWKQIVLLTRKEEDLSESVANACKVIFERAQTSAEI